MADDPSDDPKKRPGNPSWRKGRSGNPAGRPPRSARMDGWENMATSIGVLGKDKRLGARFYSDVVSDAEAAELWRGDDLAARVIEEPVAESLREGFEVKVAEDKELAEQITARLEELGATGALKKAMEYRRAYGGGAIMPVVNDGSILLSTPLNTKRVTKVVSLVVFEARELQPVKWYTDIRSPKFRQPEIYRVSPIGTAGYGFGLQDVHESRLIVFQGIQVSSDPQRTGTAPGWGDSVLTRVIRVLRDFNSAWDSAGVLVGDFSQTIWRINNLTEMITADTDGAFRARMRALEYGRSAANALLLDGEHESYERKSVNVTGLPELMDRFAQRLAAAANMPLTRLMGQSPGGMNATGESDTRGWYDYIAGIQGEVLPELERLVSFFMLEIDGPTKGREPEVWSVEWCPLWQPSDKEAADARLVQVQIDEKEHAMGVISAEEIRKSRHGGDTYSFQTVIDSDDPIEVEPTAEEAAALRDPNAPLVPGAAGAAATAVEPAKQAMNGAQVAAMVDVCVKVAAGELARESGIAILVAAFPINEKQAAAMLPPEFKVEPPPPPVPFGGGPPGGAPPPGSPGQESSPDQEKPPAPDAKVKAAKAEPDDEVPEKKPAPKPEE